MHMSTLQCGLNDTVTIANALQVFAYECLPNAPPLANKSTQVPVFRIAQVREGIKK